MNKHEVIQFLFNNKIPLSITKDGEVYDKNDRLLENINNFINIEQTDFNTSFVSVHHLLGLTWANREPSEWSDSKFKKFLDSAHRFILMVRDGKIKRVKFRKTRTNVIDLFISREGICYRIWNSEPVKIKFMFNNRLSLNKATNKRFAIFIDELVAGTYIDYPFELIKRGCQPLDFKIRHLDGNLLNNNVSNLKWEIPNIKFSSDYKTIWIDGTIAKGLDLYDRPNFYLSLNGRAFNLRSQKWIALQYSKGSPHIDCYLNDIKKAIVVPEALGQLFKDESEELWINSPFAEDIKRYKWFDEEVANGNLKPTKFKDSDGNPYYVHRSGKIISYRFRKEMVLTCDGKGYMVTSASHNGVRYRITIHRALAEAFIPIPKCYTDLGFTTKTLDINHIDGDKGNNKLSNLEWCTHKENSIKAVELGLMNSDKYCNIPTEIILDIANKKSDSFIADKFNISSTAVYELRHPLRFPSAIRWFKDRNIAL